MSRDLQLLSRFALAVCDRPDISLTECAYHARLAALRRILSRLRMRIIGHMGAFSSDERTAAWVRQYQAGIVALADMLAPATVVAAPAGTYTYGQLAAAVYPMLEALLDFIRRCFAPYCSGALKIPDKQLAPLQADMRQQIALLRRKLQQLNADTPLTGLVTEALAKYTRTDNGHTVTFRQVQYHRMIVAALLHLIRERPEHPSERVRELLFYFNFNTASFTRYYLAQLQAAADGTEDPGARRECLALLLKRNNQAVVKAGAAFHTGRPGIQELAGRWLEEELRFACLQSGRPDGYEQPPAQGVKIRTGLSMAQLACLVKLMVAGEVITHQNHTELLRWLAASVSSQHREDFSEGGLRRKFYQVERGTADAVRDILLRLAQLSRSIMLR